MPPNVQHRAMEDAIGCITQLLNAFNEWEMVAASPGAVEDMARENAQMAERIQQLEMEMEYLKKFVRDKCWSCKHKKCSVSHEPCKSCTQYLGGRRTTNNWEWRGVEEEQ